jgi:hypothetical protein
MRLRPMFSVFQFMDMRNFSIFYGFVLFMCQEQGQKSICKLSSASRSGLGILCGVYVKQI